MQVFPIALGFRMLLAANRHVQFSGGFPRENLAQPLDQRAGQRRVNHKIGAGEAKNDAGFGMCRQTGVDKQFAFIGAMDWQKKRQRRHRRNQFADQPGRLIAVKQFIRHLQVRPGKQLAAERLLQASGDITDIARAVLPRQTERKIG